MGALDTDFTGVEETDGGGFEPVPDGWYPAVIDATDVLLTNKAKQDPTGSTKGRYVSVEFTLAGDRYAGRKVWGRYNLENESQKAQDIGRGQFKRLCSSVGLDVNQVKDSDELCSRNVAIRLKTREWEGKKSNEVVDSTTPANYLEKHAGTAPAAAVNTQPPPTPTVQAAQSTAMPWG